MSRRALYDRRRFLQVSGAAGASLLLAACGDDEEQQGGSGGGGADELRGTIDFTTWGESAEIETFRALIREFERQNPGARVRLREVPFAEVRTNVDAGLEAGNAPDVFRVTYQDVGFYTSREALVDLTEYLPDGYGDAFIPALWSAVQFEDRPYGVPLHTDVSALLYNRELLRRAGVRTVPDRLEDAWTWEEFLDVSRRVRDAGGRAGHGFNWQLAGSYRWLNFLYQAGGSMLNEDGTAPAVDSPEGRRTLEFFRTWVDERLIPRNSAPRGTYVDELFPSQAIGLLFAGDFLIAGLEESVERFEFGATYLPQDREAATDIGGNALVATRDSERPRLAARFLEFMASEDSMRRFCVGAGTLPTRTALSEDEVIRYRIRPEVFQVFVEQARTLPEDLVRATTLPNFTEINNVFTRELEALIVNDQAVDQTLQNMSAGIERNLDA
jgi:multiple sugar transport system substrate-binding protein